MLQMLVIKINVVFICFVIFRHQIIIIMIIVINCLGLDQLYSNMIQIYIYIYIFKANNFLI